jgi:hypothetical protein
VGLYAVLLTNCYPVFLIVVPSSSGATALLDPEDEGTAVLRLLEKHLASTHCNIPQNVNLKLALSEANSR